MCTCVHHTVSDLLLPPRTLRTSLHSRRSQPTLPQLQLCVLRAMQLKERPADVYLHSCLSTAFDKAPVIAHMQITGCLTNERAFQPITTIECRDTKSVLRRTPKSTRKG